MDLSFWRCILVDCLQLEESQGNTLWNHRNPRQVKSNHSLYWYFSPLDIFASMPQAQFEPVRQRYVASREANVLSTELSWAKLNILTVTQCYYRLFKTNIAVNVQKV